MPTYNVEQYELHVLTYKVEANDEADAIIKVYQGEGEADNFEYAGIANDHGMSLDDDRDLADQLYDRGIIKPGHSVIPSIRSVKQVVDNGDEDEQRPSD